MILGSIVSISFIIFWASINDSLLAIKTLAPEIKGTKNSRIEISND
jgi:hypothetical protein